MEMNDDAPQVPSIALREYYEEAESKDPRLSFDLVVWMQLTPESDMKRFITGHESPLSGANNIAYHDQASVIVSQDRSGIGDAVRVALDGALAHYRKAATIGIFFFPMEAKDKRLGHHPSVPHDAANDMKRFIDRPEDQKGSIKSLYFIVDERDTLLLQALRFEFMRNRIKLEPAVVVEDI
jgi:hypothetical protein